MSIYAVVFFASLAVDLIPVIGPPAWTVMVFLLVRFDLNPWGVLLTGVPGSALGRYLMSLYISKASGKLLKPGKNEDLDFLGKRLGQKRWRSWLFVFIYSLMPLPTTPLFTAAGVAKVKPISIVPPFFCGKFISDAFMLLTGRYATTNMSDLVHGNVIVERDHQHPPGLACHRRAAVHRLAGAAAEKKAPAQFQDLEVKTRRAWVFVHGLNF